LIFYSYTHGKNDFIKVFTNLARYSFLNNFVLPIKIHNHVGRSNWLPEC